MRKKSSRLWCLVLLLFAALVLLILDQFQILTFTNKDQSAELNWLVKKYGEKYYSQGDEELIIRDFFKDRRGGFFVDVGASHYEDNSTTYYLDRNLGWFGLAIDAIPEYEEGYTAYRRRTQFFSFFVSDRSDERVKFHITVSNKRLSTYRKGRAEESGDIQEVEVMTITLNKLLEIVGIDHIDFLSMDIERAEPAALAGFDIQTYRPELVCIEAHPEVLDQILFYFEKNGYGVIEKYKEIDTLNLYFTPENEETHVVER